LSAEAGTVYHETKLTPRQLLEQRDELLKALKITRDELASFYKGLPQRLENNSQGLKSADSAISKVEGV